jgi:hypothetical protein
MGPGSYRPGRDDTRWAKLARDLHQEAIQAALGAYDGELNRSAELNTAYAGRWHIWFVALAGSVEWLARPAGNGEPLLSAWSADELVAKIEEADRGR